MEITYKRDRGDLPRNATYKSANLFLLAKRVKKALGLHYHGAPSRFVLNSIREYRQPEKFDGWFCTVFLGEQRYCGVLGTDICFSDMLREVKEEMAKRKMVQIRIDDRLHRWFKAYAADKGISMTDIIVSYLNYLKARSEESVEVKQI